MSEGAKAHELKEYRGNCHCGSFRYTVKLAPLKSATACDCSICSKNGYLWVFPIAKNHLKIEKGEGSLKQYEFGKRTMAHEFCPDCGTSLFGRRYDAPEDMNIGINVRALQEVDTSVLEVGTYEGAKLEPSYEVPKAASHVAKANDEGHLEVYEGSCHCGAVAYTIKTKPLTEAEVTFCNCSICGRNANLWIDTDKNSITLDGEKNIKSYLFGPKTFSHDFCMVCGVSVFGGLKVGELEVNARTLNGIDLAALKVKNLDGKNLYEGVYGV